MLGDVPTENKSLQKLQESSHCQRSQAIVLHSNCNEKVTGAGTDK